MMPRTWMREAVIVLGVAALGLAACKEKTPCDEGQELRSGYCWNVDAAAKVDAVATSGGSEAGGSEAGGGEAGQAADPSAFGRTCVTDADCAAPASLCAPVLFYCTALGCDVDATLCPVVGWTCMDVSAWASPGAHMCFKGS
jgi:hypothetical protein